MNKEKEGATNRKEERRIWKEKKSMERKIQKSQRRDGPGSKDKLRKKK